MSTCSVILALKLLKKIQYPMKKLPKDYKLQQNRIVRKRLLRQKEKTRLTHYTRSDRTKSLAEILKRESVDAPVIISFYPEHANETIQFVKRINNVCSEKKIKVILDFSSTDVITAAGAVYLFSELHLLYVKHGRKVVIINVDSAKQRVRSILRESGLLALANDQPQPTGNILPVIYGKDDEHSEDLLDFLMTKAVIHKRLGTANPYEAERLAGQAIREAMLNVKHHAYPNPNPNDNNQWWIIAEILDGELHIAFCDRGVGIPATLPRKNWYEHLRSTFPVDDDAKMILAAMKYTRTSKSSRSGRGLGSRDIQNLVLDRRKGHLTIISGKGHYRLSGTDTDEKTVNIGYDVSGTVIQWSIPLAEPVEVNEYE